jgi:hypothetical protein
MMRPIESFRKILVSNNCGVSRVSVMIESKLKGGVPEHSGPFRRIKIRQRFQRGGDGGKPVIKDNVELTVDVATVQIQN